MFKLVSEPTFKHKVTAHVPIDGGYEDQTFECTYRVVPAKEAGEFDLSTGEGSTKFLERVVVELGDITDADGNPLPWSDKVRDQMFALPFVRTAVAAGYWEAINKARTGN